MARKDFDDQIAQAGLNPQDVLTEAKRRGAKVDVTDLPGGGFVALTAWNYHSIDIVEEIIAEMTRPAPAPAVQQTTTAGHVDPAHCPHGDYDNHGRCYACGTYNARHSVGNLL